MINFRFDQPAFLFMGLLAIPLLLLGWRALSMTDPLRRWIALALRAILLLALAIILAGPHLRREQHQLTVIGLLDISGSVQRFADLPPINEIEQTSKTPAGRKSNPGRSGSTPSDSADSQPSPLVDTSARRSNIEYLRRWFRKATQIKEPDDRFGLVVFDGQAIAISTPTRADYVDDNIGVPIAQGTNIAQAVRLGLAMFPADSAKRLVLVTDGNETAGSVIEAVRETEGSDPGLSASAANPKSKIQNPKSNSIPIDVLPITYHITSDVQVARVEAPPTAQPGQTVTVRIILEAASPTTGSLTLRREGLPVDLNGDQPGTARHVNLPAGQSVHLAQVALGQMPINRFEAIFEADNPADDALPDNDRAEAFTATPSKGSVLVLDPNAERRENLLAQTLNAAELPALAQTPAQLPDDLLSLQNFDLIVLNNVSAAELSTKQQQMLSKFVNDLGGGLIMVGGENSFGAGGWNGTSVEKILPVQLDPRKELRLPTAALVLVLDKSGSMNFPVAGARASQQQVANEGAALAIESLRSDSLVGVVTFDMTTTVLVPLQRNDQPKKLAQIVRGITAEGGTDLEPALEEAFNMLKDAKVAKKRVVCMTDGRSHSNDGLPEIAKRMADANIQLTTIAVGDDADYDILKKLADIGGGQFYPVRDPRSLPRVLVDSVQIINKPLLKEVAFTPHVLPTGSTLTAGMESAPPLGGLVITSPRDDPKVSLEMLDPDGEPLLAYWQAGLGRVAAFTSDINGPWSQRWNDWPTAATFWTQLARTIARPAMSQDAGLIASIQDDRLNIALEMADAPDNDGDAAAAIQAGSYLQVDGTVYQPDGTGVPVRLRQAGPGRYEASIDASLSGNYIVALNPRQGTRQLAPVIGGVSRSNSPEFRRYASNLGLLEEIVEATNGRRLSVADPTAVALFDRSGMPPSISLMPIWRMILFWSLALLLLDVACRRIAWDYNLLQSMVRQAIARVTPAHIRGGQAAATLATLRQVSDDIDNRQQSQAAGVEQFRATGYVAPPPLRTASVEQRETEDDAVRPIAPEPATAEPDQSKVAAALDAILGRSKPPQPPSAPAKEPPVDPSIAAAETTGTLLAARRRARERLQGDGRNSQP